MHCESIKNLIDDSWGVKHKGPAKRKAAKGTETKAATGLASANAAGNVLVNKEELEIVPLGTDVNRKRYWVVDGTPIIFQIITRCTDISFGRLSSSMGFRKPVEEKLPLRTCLIDSMRTRRSHLISKARPAPHRPRGHSKQICGPSRYPFILPRSAPAAN